MMLNYYKIIIFNFKFNFLNICIHSSTTIMFINSFIIGYPRYSILVIVS